MNFVTSNNPGLIYLEFTPSGYEDIGIIKFKFLTKTQFLLTFIVLICRDFNMKPPQEMQ